MLSFLRFQVSSQLLLDEQPCAGCQGATQNNEPESLPSRISQSAVSEVTTTVLCSMNCHKVITLWPEGSPAKPDLINLGFAEAD